MNEIQAAQKIVEICRRLNAKNMLASADGNVSFKINADKILITPSGVNKADIAAENLAIITLDNQIVRGQPSSERLMHLQIYRSCPQAQAVVHAHPPVAIAWSIAHPNLTELPNDCMSELVLAVGRIPIVPYARPGTQDMGNQLKPFLPECRAMILARHGAISWGEDLSEAYNGMERLEHSARVLRNAIAIGGLTHLSADEMEVLKSMRKKLGERTL